ncbi:MAG: nuclear transport factor 2 family protein [Pricia sp.]
MKTILTTLLTLASVALWAQTNTEVYLLDVRTIDGKTELLNPRNISNNEGYDNQPSFYDGETILFSSTRNGQTDIARYDIKTDSVSWITDTPRGSEYSPLKIPGKNSISAIRLDTTGLQRLYEYSVWDGSSTEILDELKVAYHVWHGENIVVSSVLRDTIMSLVVSDLSDGTNREVQKNVGRSLHKIPGTDLISFISKETTPWEIRSLNPTTGEVKKVTDMYEETDDMCWFSDGTIIAADNQVLMEIHPEKQKEWQRFLRLEKREINNISRIAVSPNGKYLALVFEQSAEAIVQNQLNAYNNRDIDDFLNTYSENVQVFNFPNELRYKGRTKMREQYADFFENTPDLHCEIKNRIIIGNKVIDEEYITANGTYFSAVAIYEVENGKIAKVTFLRE